MQPLPLTRFWHHRICEAIILVSGLILALYSWAFFANIEQVSGALLVNDVAAIVAAAALILAIASYLFVPRKYIFHTSLVGYYILILMSAVLVSNTGYLSSPFIGLYLLLGVFAPVFGVYGSAVIVSGGLSYLGWQWTQGLLVWSDVATTLIIIGLPVAIGYLVWTRQNNSGSTAEDRSYSELASELSALSGQSDIVIAAITDGVISLSAKGEIQLINPAAQRIIGWGKSDALGLSYQSVLKLADNHDQPATSANDPIAQALNTNREVASDNMFVTTNEAAKKLQVSITASPIGATGNGAIVVFRDITKERADEREQTEFISTASHEMRTPVASIEGYLGLALNPATAQIDEKAREYIGKAQSSAQHLGRLFQDLLDVSKADDGRLNDDPRVVDVVPFVYDILEGQLGKASEKGLIIDYKPMPDLSADARQSERESSDRTISPVFYVNVDNDHLREVIGNLIENAIKYTPSGSITVDVTGTEHHVEVSVTDSGIGIPAEDIPHLFQKFYRVDNTDTREIGGTGLGLYLCRRLTEAMGGKLRVESTYKQGSTFFLKLPRLDSVEARQQIEKTDQVDEIGPVKISPQPVEQPTPAAPIATPPAQAAPSLPHPRPLPGVTQTLSPTTVMRPSIEEMAPRSVTTAPTAYPGQTAQARPNTPLSEIEANPHIYIREQPPQ